MVQTHIKKLLYHLGDLQAEISGHLRQRRAMQLMIAMEHLITELIDRFKGRPLFLLQRIIGSGPQMFQMSGVFFICSQIQHVLKGDPLLLQKMQALQQQRRLSAPAAAADIDLAFPLFLKQHSLFVFFHMV